MISAAHLSASQRMATYPLLFPSSSSSSSSPPSTSSTSLPTHQQPNRSTLTLYPHTAAYLFARRSSFPRGRVCPYGPCDRTPSGVPANVDMKRKQRTAGASALHVLPRATICSSFWDMSALISESQGSGARSRFHQICEPFSAKPHPPNSVLFKRQ